MFHSGHSAHFLISLLFYNSKTTWCFMLTVGPACTPPVTLDCITLTSPASIICHNVEHWSSALHHADTVWLGPGWELSVGTTTTTLQSRPVAGTLTWPGRPTELCKECLTVWMSWLTLGLSQLISQDVPSPPLTSSNLPLRYIGTLHMVVGVSSTSSMLRFRNSSHSLTVFWCHLIGVVTFLLLLHIFTNSGVPGRFAPQLLYKFIPILRVGAGGNVTDDGVYINMLI